MGLFVSQKIRGCSCKKISALCFVFLIFSWTVSRLDFDMKTRNCPKEDLRRTDRKGTDFQPF